MGMGRAVWYMNLTRFLRMQKNEAHKYTISKTKKLIYSSTC